MALAVILLLSRLILKPRTRKPSRAGTLVAGRTRCESNKTRLLAFSVTGRVPMSGSRSAIPYFQPPHRPRGGPIIDGRQWCLRPSSKALRALGSWRWRDVARGDPMLYRIGAAEGGVSSNEELRAPCPRFLEAEAEMLACAGRHPAKLGPTRDRDDLDRDHGWGAIPDDDAEAITPMPEAITPPSDESPTRGARPSP